MARRYASPEQALLACDIDHQRRRVQVELSWQPNTPPQHVELEVPEILGAIHNVEFRDDFVVVFTEGGKVGYHANEPATPKPSQSVARLNNYKRLPRTGTIHWHSLRKILRNHCFLPALARRIAVHVTYFPHWTHLGNPTCEASGWIAIDKQRVLQVPSDGFSPRDLGTAVAKIVFDDPEASLGSEAPLVASLATLHRGLSYEQVRATDAERFDHPIWRTLRDLRLRHLEPLSL